MVRTGISTEQRPLKSVRALAYHPAITSQGREHHGKQAGVQKMQLGGFGQAADGVVGLGRHQPQQNLRLKIERQIETQNPTNLK
jgi:hypothetical protein